MHPLTTLIESQRRQVRRQPSRPTPRRKSETEENAIVQGAHSQAQPGGGPRRPYWTVRVPSMPPSRWPGMAQ